MGHIKTFSLKKVERETRLELATPTLARLCSTTELFPHFCTFRSVKLPVLRWLCLSVLLLLKLWRAFYRQSISCQPQKYAFITDCLNFVKNVLFLNKSNVLPTYITRYVGKQSATYSPTKIMLRGFQIFPCRYCIYHHRPQRQDGCQIQ